MGPLALYGPFVDPKDGVPALRGGAGRIAVAAALTDRRVVASDEIDAPARVDRGECALAFVPLGMVRTRQDGRAWEVPEPLHAGLPHVVGLVQRKDAHPKARELRDFLLGEATQQTLAESGWQRGR